MDINSKTALEAIKGGRIDILEKLLHEGLDVNHKSKNGQTYLYEAVASHNVEIVKLLLTMGAYVNVKDKNNNGESPLHEAVRSDQVAMVKILLEADAYVNARNKRGRTPLYLALQNGRKNTREIVILLINKGADVNAVTKNGTTLLYMAIRNNQTEIVKILLEHNTDINRTSANGNNPLLEAVSRDNLEITELLLYNGADINFKNEYDGETAVYMAVLKENIEMVKLLVAHGADINNTLINDINLLTTCIVSGRRDIVTVLLDNGVDLTVQDNTGNTALHEAAYYGRLELVEQLIKKGATVDAKNKDGDTPLNRATQRGYQNYQPFESKTDKTLYYTTTGPASTNIIKILLKYGADIEAKNRLQETPLLSSVRYSNLPLVDFLLDNGADITVQDNYGNTALHEAAYFGCLQLVENLIKKGATVDAKNNDGDTPLHRASQCGYQNDQTFESKTDNTLYYIITEPTSTEIIKVLLNNGADIEAKNKRQETPLFSAVRHNKGSLVDFLLDNEADINHKSGCGTTCINILTATRDTLPKEMITLLQRHIIKRKSAGFYLNKEILEKYRPFDMFDYQTKCIREIIYLKNEFFYDGISLFDLLSKPTTQLTYYLQISDMTKSISSSKFKTNCTQYYNMIYNKVQSAARRKDLLKYVEIFFDSLSIRLPYVCREYITSYLDIADFIILEKLFK